LTDKELCIVKLRHSNDLQMTLMGIVINLINRIAITYDQYNNLNNFSYTRFVLFLDRMIVRYKNLEKYTYTHCLQIHFPNIFRSLNLFKAFRFFGNQSTK